VKTCYLVPCLALVAGLLWVNSAPAAEGQYINLKITVKSKGILLKLDNATLKWGKFHRGDKVEISAWQIRLMPFISNKPSWVYACGADGAAAGTEGSIDLYDADPLGDRGVLIGTFSWDSPYGTSGNRATFTANPKARARGNKEYSVVVIRANQTDKGPLGEVSLEVSLIAD
jgi:hypothetical protein